MSVEADRIEALVKQRIEGNYFAQRGGDLRPGSGLWSLELPGASKETGLDIKRKRFSLAELLAYHDRAFVRNAYLVLLKRDVDVGGLDDRLRKLQSGEMSRVELLFRLRYCSEGKQRGVRVRGLLRAFFIERLCRLPILGLLPRYVVALARLPRMQRDVEQLRGLVDMYKNDSDERDQAITDFLHKELRRQSGHSGDLER